MATQKELGTKAFTAKDFNKAIEHFTNAINENPGDHTLYSNRSACYYNLNQFTKAQEDGEKCISVKPDWGKGYQRRAMALHGLGKFDEALQDYEKGIQLDPENAQLKQGFEKCKADKAEAESEEQGMFGPQAMAKLMTNPRIANYFQDPMFRNTFELVKRDPQSLMTVMQRDPRFMDVFKELTGIDLMDMQAQQAKQKEQMEEMRKKAEEERKRKEQEELERKKKEEEEALPEEEKQQLAIKKQAEAKKNEGNEFYKKKDFAKALALYDEALTLNENEVTYHNNKAACYFEMKDYDKCIEECDVAIEKSKGANYDYVKLGKAIARKANAKLQQNKFDEAIELYQASLLESNDPAVKDQKKKAERAKQDYEAKMYINPEKAEEHRLAGNALFEKGDFPGAIKEYNEGLRRDPQSKALYSNRCAAYIKLMEAPTALKDAEKCLQLDPNFVKGWARKGICHHMMKEYHKALEAFDKGLKMDPTNKDCMEGKQKTMMTIQMGAYGGDKPDEERVRHAMADPEIQMLLRDPRVTQVLKDLQENPAAAQGALKDPFISEALNKLIAAGIVKMA